MFTGEQLRPFFLRICEKASFAKQAPGDGSEQAAGGNCCSSFRHSLYSWPLWSQGRSHVVRGGRCGGMLCSWVVLAVAVDFTPSCVCHHSGEELLIWLLMLMK